MGAETSTSANNTSGVLSGAATPQHGAGVAAAALQDTAATNKSHKAAKANPSSKSSQKRSALSVAPAASDSGAQHASAAADAALPPTKKRHPAASAALSAAGSAQAHKTPLVAAGMAAAIPAASAASASQAPAADPAGYETEDASMTEDESSVNGIAEQDAAHMSGQAATPTDGADKKKRRRGRRAGNLRRHGLVNFSMTVRAGYRAECLSTPPHLGRRHKKREEGNGEAAGSHAEPSATAAPEAGSAAKTPTKSKGQSQAATPATAVRQLQMVIFLPPPLRMTA